MAGRSLAVSASRMTAQPAGRVALACRVANRPHSQGGEMNRQHDRLRRGSAVLHHVPSSRPFITSPFSSLHHTPASHTCTHSSSDNFNQFLEKWLTEVLLDSFKVSCLCVCVDVNPAQLLHSRVYTHACTCTLTSKPKTPSAHT